MDKVEPRSVSVHHERNTSLQKRAAPEEPNTTSDSKRIKTSHDGSPKLDMQPQAEAVPGEESIIILTGLKCLLQKQLPKMPKDYIARLVYNRTHLSIAIMKRPLEVIGGITYREFRRRKFAEIVFWAVSSDQQVKGYGAYMMAHLKDYVKATGPGFTKEITLDKSVWMGYIKDYEGGMLMQFSMLPRIRYLEAGRMLLKQKETVLAKIRALSKSHIIHQPPRQWTANGATTPIDPLSIPGIRATGWSPDMDALARVPRHGPHFNELRRFLYQIQNHKQAWPFLTPVNTDEVPDYYNVITSPMDLSTMEEKLERDLYVTPKDLVADLKLIFSKCRQYNDATTVYTKCAVKIEKYMWALIKEIPEWYDLKNDWDFGYLKSVMDDRVRIVRRAGW
ncbi:histone acetyltransferase [Achaetomium macrosporum]|uniref:Histone acetyltransferase n=1 Tax=Achaetomium macrosporum TaxID=79813 RepID=A0AAN7HFX8_9PEZI|nr:histone acetyltransferase [Achaetomium macrosporum]